MSATIVEKMLESIFPEIEGTRALASDAEQTRAIKLAPTNGNIYVYWKAIGARPCPIFGFVRQVEILSGTKKEFLVACSFKSLTKDSVTFSFEKNGIKGEFSVDESRIVIVYGE